LKKWLDILLLTILAVGLTACNDTAEPVEEADTTEDVDEEEATTEEENEEEEEEDDSVSEMTVQEVYEEALKASEAMESVEMLMNIEQEINSPDGSETIHSNIEANTEMTMEPLTMYQSAQTTMLLDDEEIASNMEMYVTEEDFFLYEEQLDEWIKVDASFMGDLSDLTNQQDPPDQLEMFQDFVSDFDFEQTEDEFILKLTADGEEFTSVMREMAKESMPPEIAEGMAEEGLDVFEQMDINNMSYEMYLDKETFNLMNFKMDMDMDLEVEGESSNINQTIEAEYVSINETEPVEVPEEVEEEAIDESELIDESEF